MHSLTVPSRLAVALALTGAALIAPLAAADDYDYRIVTRTGLNAPGGGGFVNFGLISINDTGQVAFTGSTGSATFAHTGMWKTPADNPQTVELIAGEFYPVPGVPGDAVFGVFDFSFFHPLLNPDGDVGFAAPVEGLPVDHTTAIFRQIDGVVAPVAVPGQIVPGGGLGETFGSMSNLPKMNDSLQMAFRANIEGPNVDETNDRAIFAHGGGGGLGVVLRKGAPAPGLFGSTIDHVHWHPQITGNGAVTFAASTTGWFDVNVWYQGWADALDRLTFEGDLTTDDHTVVQPTGFWMSSAANDLAGLPMFVEDADEDIQFGYFMVEDGGVLTPPAPVAVTGALGPLGIYNDLREDAMAINTSGDAVFPARFSWFNLPADVDSAVLFKAFDAPTEILVREGDPAPGYWNDVEFDDLMADWISFADDDGRRYFTARVRGPGIAPEIARGLWCVEPGGDVNLVIRAGQLIDTGDDVLRAVEHFSITSGTGADSGRRPGVNTHGDVALAVHFFDGTNAVVVAQRPSPCLGDLNGDGVVDPQDLAIVLAHWGQVGPIGAHGDVDRDGDTDAQDLAIVLANWGNVCPS